MCQDAIMRIVKGVKILSEKILSAGFAKLYEYHLQMPGLSSPEHRAVITREVLKCSNSVVVLIFARDRQGFVLCEEYRTGIALNENEDSPLLLQCVAGMIDKDKSPEEIARMEAMEEAGVELGALHHIADVYNSPGRMTERTSLYYAEIDRAPEEGYFGLPEEGEEIRTRIIPKEEIFRMMDEKKIIDSMTLNALQWFRARGK